MIRYDSRYNNEISRIVSNFNRKIARVDAKGLPTPAKVSIRSIKSQFDNRRDLNTFLRDLQIYNRKGAEKIVSIGGKDFTQYEVEIFKRRLQRERRNLTRDIRESEQIQSKYPMQHDIYTTNLRVRREKLSAKWSNLIVGKLATKIIEEPVKRSETYDNWLNILFQDAYVIDYDSDKIEYIKSKLLTLGPRQFIKALRDDPNIQFIFDYYHSLTRQSGAATSATDAFDQLYENIDEIVNTYK